MKLFFTSQSNMAFPDFDQSLSFPTASHGNDDSGNEIAAVFEIWGAWHCRARRPVENSLLPIVLALFLALFCFESTFFYILSQKALLAFFLIFDWLFVKFCVKQHNLTSYMSSKAAFCTHFSQRSRGSWGIGLIGQRLPSRVHDPSHSFQDGVIHEQQWKSAKQGRDSSRAYSAINQWKK